MARSVFYSFHYDADCERAAQVRNIGAVAGNAPTSDNDWESIKRGGEAAIQRWIDGQLTRRVCTIVLIGTGTAGRKWIDYEIKRSWNEGKAVVGIHIHNLKNLRGLQSAKGGNPFSGFSVNGTNLADIVRTYDPPSTDSKAVYAYISGHLSGWVEEAILVRGRYN